ncbi:MAG: Spx/MgsR family RNA polymerase-binding regulatory protein [Cyanobacteriota bacterium]|jgi:arsenate reductase
MSVHRFYGYGPCGTCRKALAWLSERSIAVEIVDITTTPPGPDELRQALSQLGRGRLFNTSGQSYRALGAERVKAMNDDQALAALSGDGRLIKRPFLVTSGGSILTGFKHPEWSKILA